MHGATHIKIQKVVALIIWVLPKTEARTKNSAGGMGGGGGLDDKN
jgi:hypothetical protein